MEKRIIILDDEEQCAIWWKKQIEQCSIECDIFSRPQKALDFFTKKPEQYAGAILDVWYPYEKLDGLEVALRMLAYNGLMRILFSTGITNESSLVMLRQHGEVVSKPIQGIDYSHTITKFIRSLPAKM